MNRRATKHEPDGTGPNNHRVYTADAAPHHCGRLALPSAGQMHPACRLRKRTVVSERQVVAGKKATLRTIWDNRLRSLSSCSP